MKSELSERSIHLLHALIERYIRDGNPVGSKLLSRDSALSLSSASIRNIMAELEEAGYIRSPHTSAGRVPTDLGYRLFVDSVVTASTTMETEFADKISAGFEREREPGKLLESASNLLSSMTHQAGLVMIPHATSVSFRQVEFLPLSDRRVLAILVLNEKEVQNRIVHVDRDYSESELQQAAAYINYHYSGRDVNAVRAVLLDSMEQDKSEIDAIMQTAIDVANKALDGIDQREADYVVAGQANLLDQKLDDMVRLKELFEAFQQKKDILHLMERCATGQGMQIFIGEESGCHVLDDFSIVTATYESDSRQVGVLGVIGPTRMEYERVIPMVDVTARLLSAALKR